MNLLDVILIVVIAFSSVYGLFKGLVKEVISLLALIIGLIGASRFYEGASPLLKDLGLSEQVARILSFIILFIVIFVALILIGKLIHKLVHAIFLGWLNRLGGIGFGFIRGIIVSGIIIMILTIILSEKAPILSESKLAPHIMSISKVLVSLVPDDLQKRFMENEKKLREFWERKSKPKMVGICQKGCRKFKSSPRYQTNARGYGTCCSPFFVGLCPESAPQAPPLWAGSRGTILNSKSLPGSPALCLSRPNGARRASQICDPAGILDFGHDEALSLGRTVWTPKKP